MATRRLFFALWPTVAEQTALAAAVGPVLDATRGGRCVPRENLHLTLAFLGSVPESSLAALRALMPGIGALQAPLTVVLDHIDYWRRSEILCATASSPPIAASALAERLKQALVAAQFAPDLKPFRAHVTLARKVRGIARPLELRPVTWTFTEFALIESRTEASGSLYSALDSWALCKPRGAAEIE
jgi:RNA 2',3'-cyclic 3'-phosphodiesterase